MDKQPIAALTFSCRFTARSPKHVGGRRESRAPAKVRAQPNRQSPGETRWPVAAESLVSRSRTRRLRQRPRIRQRHRAAVLADIGCTTVTVMPRIAAVRNRAVTLRPTTAGSTRFVAGRRPGAPTSTTSPWPAVRTTDSLRNAGRPAPTPKATPNGYRRRTWTTGNPASTPTHPEKLLAPDDDEPV
jgi:hypothetical protein